MKLSFKKEKRETGLASVGNPHPATTVKANGKQCGTIHPPSWRTKDSKWSVSFAVVGGKSFNWKHLKQRFDSEPQAREYIKAQWPLIQEKLVLHLFED